MNKKLVIDLDANIARLTAKMEAAERIAVTSAKRMEKAYNGVVAATAALGLGMFFKDAISQSMEAAASMRMVEQVVKQTGQGAGFTAVQLKGMADRLEEISAIDADQVMNDITLQFLTFGNIQGEVFERAQVAAMDLSAVLGTDLQGSAIQLGKALDDPILGMTALRRSGVMFTEAQQKQIKDYVKHNELIKAQGLILDEVNSKYGGQAKALAESTGGMQAASIAWGNFMEEVGNSIMPVVSGVVKFGTEALKEFINFFKIAGGLGTDENGASRKGEYAKAILGLSEEQLATEREILSYYYSENVLKQKGLLTYSVEYRSLQAQNKALAEQMEVINEINKAKVTPVKVGGGKLVDEAAAEKAKRLKEKELTDKENAIRGYYDKVKFLDDNYYEYRVAQIKKEAEAIGAKSGGGIDQVIYMNTLLGELNDAKEEFFAAPAIFDSVETDKFFEDYIAGIDEAEAAWTEAEILRYDRDLQMEAQLQSERLNAASELGNALTGAFSRSGKSLLSYMNMALQAGLKIASTISSMKSNQTDGASGMMGIFGSLIGMFSGFGLFHSGGTISNYGGGSGSIQPYMGMAGGGSFIVPPGYPNDSFPIRVESGEEISVRPAGSRGGDMSGILNELMNLRAAVEAQHLTLAKKEYNVTIVSGIEGEKFEKQYGQPARARLGQGGIRNEF